ncbi:MAG: hypothetical protein ACOCTM_03175 [Bacteroidota bacterium]
MPNANLGTLLYYVRAKNNQFKGEMRENKNEIRDFDDQAKRSQKTLGDYSESFKRAGMVLTGFGVIVTGVNFKLAKLASDANEIQSRFEHVFGEMSDSANDWAESFANEFNQSRSEIKSMMATLQDTLVPMGVAEDKAFELNKQITELAIDMSSFANVPLEKAMSDIQSAIVGQSRPMRKYGSVLTETRVAANALEQGIIDTDRELTEQEKILSRVDLMMQDMTKAQGDYKRTQDSFANQLRETRNLLKNVGEEIGEIVLPTFQDLLSTGKSVLEWFDDLPDGIQETIVKFTTLSGIVAGILGPISIFVGFLPQIATGLSMISGAAAPLLIGGGIVAGIIAIKGAFESLNDAQERNLEKTKEQVEESKKLVTEYEELAEKESKSEEEKEKLRRVARDLADIYPDAVEGIDEETGALEINTETVNKNDEAKEMAWRAEKTRQNIRDLQGDIEELNEEYDKVADAVPEESWEEEFQTRIDQMNRLLREMGVLAEDEALSMDELFGLKDTEIWDEMNDHQREIFENHRKSSQESFSLQQEAAEEAEKLNSILDEKNEKLEKELEVRELQEKYRSSEITREEYEEQAAGVYDSGGRDEREEEKDAEESSDSWVRIQRKSQKNYSDYMDEYIREVQSELNDLVTLGKKEEQEYIDFLEQQYQNEHLSLGLRADLYREYLNRTEEEQEETIDERIQERQRELEAEATLDKDREENYIDFLEKQSQNKELSIEYRAQLHEEYLRLTEEEEKRSGDERKKYAQQLNDELLELEEEGLERQKQAELNQLEEEKQRELEEAENYEDSEELKTKIKEIYAQRRQEIHEDYAEREVETEEQIKQQMYELELISTEEYKDFLKERLESYEKHSEEWLRIKQMIENIGDDGGGDGDLNNLEQMFEDVGYSAEEAQGNFDKFRDGLVDGFTRAITEGENLLDVLKNIADQMAKLIVRRGIVEPAVDYLLNAAQLASAHSGAVVTPQGLVQDLPSYHNGGVPGVSPDERIVKVLEGERILSPDQNNAFEKMMSGGNNGGANPRNVVVINATDPKSFSDRLRQNSDTLVDEASRNILENGALRELIKRLNR